MAKLLSVSIVMIIVIITITNTQIKVRLNIITKYYKVKVTFYNFKYSHCKARL